ncbi:MAG TPA: PAS domain-containing sensor histidine kinase [Verrucomicrobiae bacterium]|nr:PAS domain-containing sensor histidine kinase [Verrucomicrobiae bacterium]
MIRLLASRERVLRESSEIYTKAFRVSPDAISITDMETGRFIEINDSFERFFGYKHNEVIGRTSNELGFWSTPQDRDRLIELVKLRGSVRDFKTSGHTRAGGLKIGLVSAEMVEIAGRPALVLLVRDITNREKAAQALRESEEKFSKAFRTSPDVMSIADFETGRYIEVNDAHEKIFGFKREEVIGRSPTELGIFENPAVREKIWKSLEANGSVRDVEIEARTRDGKRLTLLHNAELIELGGRKCVLRVSHDITERQEAILREQQARREYTLQLIASQEAERARIATELHDSIGQNLLHFRNRLQSVLNKKNLPVKLRKQFEDMNDLAMQTIEEVRRISHDMHPYQLDHLGLTRALASLIESTKQASAVAFEQRIENVDDLFSKDAATNLYRIVQESLNNILKHSRAKKVRITLERDIHEVHLKIADNGRGFAPAKSHKTTKGLGLRNIAEHAQVLNGQFQLNSKPGKGTTLEITIPVSNGRKSAKNARK